MENELQIYNTKELKDLDESKAEQIKAIFAPMYIMLKGFENEYFGIIKEVETNGVTKESTIKAKRLRLDIGKIRIKADKFRKEAKEEYLRAGKAIDGVSNIIKWAAVDKENKLKKIEDYLEIKEKERLSELQNIRLESISKYIDTCHEGHGLIDFSAMSDENWGYHFDMIKRDYEHKVEAERKAEVNRIETERREQIEREKKEQEATKERDRLRKEHEEIRLANERLKKEAAEKERIIAEGERSAKKKEQEFIQKELEIKRIANENERLKKEREIEEAKAAENKIINKVHEHLAQKTVKCKEKEELSNIEKTLQQERACLDSFVVFLNKHFECTEPDVCEAVEDAITPYLEHREAELKKRE